MVSQREKALMRNFAVGKIEQSERYKIKEVDNLHILLAQRSDLVENPKTIEVLLHNAPITISNYKRRVIQNFHQGIYTADLFYKNGKTFMVRLAERGALKGDDKSLKLYTKEDIDKMIHLRGLEKACLDFQGNVPFLAYYQPETERLTTGIRTYRMKSVKLDYSHIGYDDPRHSFVSATISLDYRIAKEIPEMLITDNEIVFRTIKTHYNKALMSPKQTN